jgi:hypothetical protein
MGETVRHLENITLANFSFFKREMRKGKVVSNQCGRDFLYYALCYSAPMLVGGISAQQISERRVFGLHLPSYLAWTQLQFLRVPALFASHGLKLSINTRAITSWWQFVRGILFSRMTTTQAIEYIQARIRQNRAVGIDISLGMYGLLDHVLFVYGYDSEGFIVFETTKTKLAYTCLDEEKGIFHLPYTEIGRRWTRFGRVWCVELKN